MLKRDTFKINRMSRVYTEGSGEQYYVIYKNFLDTTHILIAGVTGSGKSVVINGMLSSVLRYSNPGMHRFLFIDPKQVELDAYSDLPLWNKGYADDIRSAVLLLKEASEELDKRMAEVKRMRKREYQGYHLHIVIDEYADLTRNAEYPELRRDVERYISKIARMGRAARIHLIIATQRSTAQVITGELKTNIDFRLCLRMSNAQESRNVLDTGGAELLPAHGVGLYKTPMGIQAVKIPMVTDEEIRRSVSWWVNYKQTGSIKRV